MTAGVMNIGMNIGMTAGVMNIGIKERGLKKRGSKEGVRKKKGEGYT